MTQLVPFNRPSMMGNELTLLHEAMTGRKWSGDGPMTQEAQRLLSQLVANRPALLTTNCTHALELCARLLCIRPGDEVIVPSYTFPSTAAAFALAGADIVFVDVLPDTLNIDPDGLRDAISDDTAAIITVHYAGIADRLDEVTNIAEEHGIALVEDNAHGLGGRYQSQPLGSIGTFSTCSFHETKNITCGEGGALIINDDHYLSRAEILREKGTDRARFMRGQVDKYTWRDIGSSWLPSELLAAILVAQLQQFNQIQARRMHTWDVYHNALQSWATTLGVRQPHVPKGADHTAHMYYLHMNDLEQRTRFISHMQDRGVMCVFHYQALNTSPQGWAFGGQPGQCPVAESAADTLVRLPLFNDITHDDRMQVVDACLAFQG